MKKFALMMVLGLALGLMVSPASAFFFGGGGCGGGFGGGFGGGYGYCGPAYCAPMCAPMCGPWYGYCGPCYPMACPPMGKPFKKAKAPK